MILYEKYDKLTISEEISSKKLSDSNENSNEFGKFEIQNIEIKETREILRNNVKITVKKLIFKEKTRFL